MSKITSQLVNDDRENLFVELSMDGEVLGEVENETPELRFIVFPRRDGEPWCLNLPDILQALTVAKNRLTNKG
jgi:hypothetical protein